MSRSDLTEIQTKLKIAIQSHQVLVTKMKNEPQNQELTQQLHNIQKEIFRLSEQQKGIVQSLKKEIVHRQPATVAQLVQQSKQVPVAQVPITPPIILPMTAQPLVQVLPKPIGVTQPIGMAHQMVAQPVGISQPINIASQISQPINIASQISQPINIAPQVSQPISISSQISQPISINPQLSQPIVINPQMGVSQAMCVSPGMTQPTFQLTATMQPMIGQMMQPLQTIRPVQNPAFYKQPIQPKPSVENVPPNHVNSIAVPPKVTQPQEVKDNSVSQGQASVTPRSSSPPIRVPQYSLHRPAILQNSNKSPISKPAAAPSNSYYTRKPSDYDKNDNSKAHEGKSLVSNEEKEKIAFIAALDLVTKETLKEMQNRRYERKRRTTANPLYNFEPEVRRRPHSLMLNNNLPNGKRGRGRPPKGRGSPTNSHPSTPDSQDSNLTNGHSKNGTVDVHDDYCNVCGQSGQLLLCDTCSKVYHLQCLDPPLLEIPEGRWGCPKCQASGRFGWSSETITMVNNFIAKKTAKEEERRKLQKKNNELVNEKVLLENKTKQLNDNFSTQLQKKDDLLERNRLYQQKVENLKNFIKVIQSS